MVNIIKRALFKVAASWKSLSLQKNKQTNKQNKTNEVNG